MEPSAEERIAQVQSQAPDVETGEQIADASSKASMGVGLALASKGGWVGLAAYGAGMVGGMAGSALAEELGVADTVANGLETMGMHRVGAGGPHPAHITHQVAHSYAFAGFLASVAIGIVAAAAVGALIVATGGAAAVVLVGAAAAGGFATGFLGNAVAGAAAQVGVRTGAILAPGSPDVLIGYKRAARMTDLAQCSKEPAPVPIIEGSATIFVNSLPLARIGHKLLCGAVVDEGVESVFIDSTTVACAQASPEVPVWARVLVDWAGFLSLGKAAAWAGKTTRSKTTNQTKSQCKTTKGGDPVDVVAGAFVEWRTDIDIPGILPLQLNRLYSSQTHLPYPTLFGPGWTDSWSIRLRRLPQRMEYWDEEGVCFVFDTPYPALDAAHEFLPHIRLLGTPEAPLLVDERLGVTYHFGWQGEWAQLTHVSDRSENAYRLYYDDGRLLRIEHSDGYRLACRWQSYHGTMILSSIWYEEAGRESVELVRYAFDEHRRLIQGQSEYSGQLYYKYDLLHRMVGWGDATHTHVSISYDSSGRVQEVKTPGGVHDGQFAYDPENRCTRVTSGGITTLYEYNAQQLVTRITNALGQVEQTEWNAREEKITSVGKRGQVTRFEYTSEGDLATIVSPSGAKATIQYDAAGKVTSYASEKGLTWTWIYDPLGRLASAQAPTGATRAWMYDARGRVVQMREDSPSGQPRVTAYEYDDRGIPCAEVLPLGTRWAWVQDRLGRLQQQTDPLGHVTRYEYDSPSADRVRHPRLRAHQGPIKVLLPTGDQLRIEYNAEGLISRSVDPSGAEHTYEWGAFDLLRAETDAAGQRTHYEYGAEGRLEAVVNAEGKRWQFRFDAAGQRVSEEDFTGRLTLYRYDSQGRLVARVSPDGAETSFRWDAQERLIEKQAGDCVIQYEYDDLGRPASARVVRDSVLEAETHWKYDAFSRLAETHQNGQTLRWTYDAFGQCLERVTPLGTTRFQYDGQGQLERLDAATGGISLERDALGHPLRRSSLISRIGEEDSQVPGFCLEQRFDPVGRLLSQHLNSTPFAPANTAAGPGLFPVPGQVQPQHGLLRHYRWKQGRLTGVEDSRHGSVRYELDARDQIVRAQYGFESASGALESPATAGLRCTVPAQVANEQFTYSRMGDVATAEIQRLMRAGGAPESQTFVYAKGAVVRRGDFRYSHDACGRLVEKVEYRNGFRPRTWRFEWDGFDRLVQAHTPEGETWRYRYDALGRRIEKRCVAAASGRRAQRYGMRERYLWDGATLAVEVRDTVQGAQRAHGTQDAPAPWGVAADALEDAVFPVHSGEAREWLYEPGEDAPLALHRCREGVEELLHVVTDQVGAPREVLTGDGEVVWAVQLQVWGGLNQLWQKLSPSTGTSEDGAYLELGLRFPNQWEDAETGLCYNFYRYYDPGLGQYISPDPIGIEGGLRPHGYVHNPSTWVDPEGLAACPYSGDPFPGMSPRQGLHSPLKAPKSDYHNFPLQDPRKTPLNPSELPPGKTVEDVLRDAWANPEPGGSVNQSNGEFFSDVGYPVNTAGQSRMQLRVGNDGVHGWPAP